MSSDQKSGPPPDAAETVLSANRIAARSSVGGNRGRLVDGVPEPAVQPPATNRPPGVIISAVSRFNIAMRGPQIALMIGIVFSSVGVLVVAINLLRSPRLFLPVFIAWTLIGVLGLVFGSRSHAAARGEKLGRECKPENWADTLIQLTREVRGFGARSGLKSFLGELEKRGLLGFTFRIVGQPRKSKSPADEPNLSPLDFPFEPQLLNEALSPLIRESAGGTAKRGTTSPLIRNVMLKGGLATLIMFLIQFAIAAFTSIVKRRPEPGLYSWGAAILILLFLPVGMRLWTTKEWLVVPGGVLLRRATRGAGDWKLHLFDRESSLLLVAMTRKGNCLAAIVDNTSTEFSLLTPAEGEFLLRAWASPVPPPPVELLGELGSNA